MTMQGSDVPNAAPVSADDKILANLSKVLDGEREVPAVDEFVERPGKAKPKQSQEEPPRKPQKREELPEEQEVDEPDDDEPDAAAADDESEAEDDESQTDSEPARGSKDNPYTVKDLPEDVFFELKIDGEKQLVSASELGKSYIGEKTITRRLNATQQLTARAEEYIKKAEAFPAKFQQNFREFTQSPEQMFGFFFDVEPHEIPTLHRFLQMQPPKSKAEAAERFAEMAAHMLIDERKRPGAREQREALVERRRVERERQAFQEQKEREVRERQQAEANQRARAIFEPGWADGLKRTGFPQLTKETHQKLYEETVVRIQQRMRMRPGEPITSDDVAELTARAVRTLQEAKVIPTGKGKPKPVTPGAIFGRKDAQEPQGGAQARKPGQRQGQKSWDQVPAHKRREDPDFFLRNARAKDFIKR